MTETPENIEVTPTTEVAPVVETTPVVTEPTPEVIQSVETTPEPTQEVTQPVTPEVQQSAEPTETIDNPLSSWDITVPSEADLLKKKVQEYEEILQDQFITEYITETKSGKSLKDVLSKYKFEDYQGMASENPRELHDKYWKEQFPNMTETQMENAWEDFTKGRTPDEFSPMQLKELNEFAGTLSAKQGQVGTATTQPKMTKEEAQALQVKQTQENEAHLKQWRDKVVGVKLFANEKGEGGIEISQDIIDIALQKVHGLFSDFNNVFNEKKQFKEGFLNEFVKSTLISQRLPTIQKVIASAAKMEVLNKNAHLDAKGGTVQAPPNPDAGSKTPDQQKAESSAHLRKQLGLPN